MHTLELLHLQPSDTARKVTWLVCKVSITRNPSCTLLPQGLLSELVYGFCNYKESLAK